MAYMTVMKNANAPSLPGGFLRAPSKAAPTRNIARCDKKTSIRTLLDFGISNSLLWTFSGSNLDGNQ
jgi:hypothetical protein